MPVAVDHLTYLAPGHVMHVAGARVQVAVLGESVWAEMATGYPYQPCEGDTVLVIGQQSSCYVIGVLSGRGTTTWTVPGDLKISAPQGRIVLSSGQAVSIKGPVVEVTAHRLEIVARVACEKFGVVTRWVKQTFQLRAERMRTRITGVYDLGVHRLRARAKEDVKIDGRKIHLG